MADPVRPGARHDDATTALHGWVVRWFLTHSDMVVVVGATTPRGEEVAFPVEGVPLGIAHQYIPAALCERVKGEKFDHCPWMKAFMRNHRAARESWHEYWERHPEANNGKLIETADTPAPRRLQSVPGPAVAGMAQV